MAEYRYNGLNSRKKRIVGYLTAATKKEARVRVDSLARQYRFELISLQKKTIFLYRYRKRDGTLVRGEQQAYAREDLELALQQMGYKEIKVEKSLLNLNFKPPYSDVISFIRLTADLLHEKLPFDEIMQLMQIDASNKSMKKMIKEVISDLKDGMDGEEVFRKQAWALGEFPSKMLGVASKSGNMAEIYENTAKFLERDYEFKKSIRSALLMPTITLLVLFGAVVFYVGYIFPKTAEMFARVGATLPPMTAFTLEASYFITDNLVWILLAVIVPPIILWQLAKTEKGKVVTGKYMIRMPVMGSLMHKSSIEIFCRVFYSMYSGSGENIEVIRTAAEACRNKYMEKQIKEITIPMMVRRGQGFVESLKASDVFTVNAITRFNTGAESGTLKKVALQIAKYYEKETSYRMKAITEWIQVVIGLVIMLVMTALTIVSSETAVVQPELPGM
ncbi:MAG: type II secretion system F family protein [candidate division KSB1 bacterium]|nr:type II secretion system F family protein [candidate division KSB1 bacterium]